MNHKQFEAWAFRNGAHYVQPQYVGKEKIAATAVTQHNAKVIAFWLPRKGIVWTSIKGLV